MVTEVDAGVEIDGGMLMRKLGDVGGIRAKIGDGGLGQRPGGIDTTIAIGQADGIEAGAGGVNREGKEDGGCVWATEQRGRVV